MSSQIKLVPVKTKISQQLVDFSLGRTLVASAKVNINTRAAVTMESTLVEKSYKQITKITVQSTSDKCV